MLEPVAVAARRSVRRDRRLVQDDPRRPKAARAAASRAATRGAPARLGAVARRPRVEKERRRSGSDRGSTSACRPSRRTTHAGAPAPPSTARLPTGSRAPRRPLGTDRRAASWTSCRAAAGCSSSRSRRTAGATRGDDAAEDREAVVRVLVGRARAQSRTGCRRAASAVKLSSVSASC